MSTDTKSLVTQAIESLEVTCVSIEEKRALANLKQAKEWLEGANYVP